MIVERAVAALPVALLLSCSNPPATVTTPGTPDTDTAEPQVLPIDTGSFVPQDTAPDVPPDITPDHWVYIQQTGIWNLSPASPPFTDVIGSLVLQEYIDALDTAVPNYECNVTYSLTGSVVQGHTCAECDWVMEVEHFVTSGDPNTCHDPDAPPDGSSWQLGYDGATSRILLNYYGTDVWLGWYDADLAGSQIDFGWSGTLAIELEDTGDM
jgi:hypothetical protein